MTTTTIANSQRFSKIGGPSNGLGPRTRVDAVCSKGAFENGKGKADIYINPSTRPPRCLE